MAVKSTIDKNVMAGGAPIYATLRYPATPVDGAFFVAPRAMRVTAIYFRPLAAAASATAMVKKAPSGTASASGTALHTNAFTLDGTADTNQVGALSVTAADLDLAAGDALCLDVTGTTTNATGIVTVELAVK